MRAFFVLSLLYPTWASSLPQAVTDSSAFSWHAKKALLAFGDSYTYVQGAAGRQNYSFIADALSPNYTPQQLLNDTIVQNQIGTSAGGPNYVEYLTRCGLKSIRPIECVAHNQKQLWDFAFAGADVSTRYLPLHHNYSVDLGSQITSFNQQAFANLPVKPDETLVTIWIGINDVSDSAKNTSIASFPAFYEQIINTLFESVTVLHDLGYHDYLFLNLPPLEHTPGNVVAVSQNKTLSPSALQVAQWNKQLANTSTTFQAHNPDFNIILFDTHSFLNNVWENPAPYGIVNTTGYCAHYDAPDIDTNYTSYGCLPIHQYFWYNTGHITYHVHEILADGIRQFLESFGKVPG